MSLGEETDSLSYEETDRNRDIIPQVDGTMDSRDSLDQTADSIDLTESPVKNTNTQSDIEMKIKVMMMLYFDSREQNLA